MRANDLDPGRLRRLAGLKAPDGATVLSIYVDLDPMTFGTPPARRSQISSLIDGLGRDLRAADLPHDGSLAARQDLERARTALGDASPTPTAPGHRALRLRTRRPLRARAPAPPRRHARRRRRLALDRAAGPLGRSEALAVALVDRRNLRLLYGGRDSLEQLTDEEGLLGRTPRRAARRPRRTTGRPTTRRSSTSSASATCSSACRSAGASTAC